MRQTVAGTDERDGRFCAGMTVERTEAAGVLGIGAPTGAGVGAGTDARTRFAEETRRGLATAAERFAGRLVAERLAAGFTVDFVAGLTTDFATRLTVDFAAGFTVLFAAGF